MDLDRFRELVNSTRPRLNSSMQPSDMAQALGVCAAEPDYGVGPIRAGA